MCRYSRMAWIFSATTPSHRYKHRAVVRPAIQPCEPSPNFKPSQSQTSPLISAVCRLLLQCLAASRFCSRLPVANMRCIECLSANVSLPMPYADHDLRSSRRANANKIAARHAAPLGSEQVCLPDTQVLTTQSPSFYRKLSLATKARGKREEHQWPDLATTPAPCYSVRIPSRVAMYFPTSMRAHL